MNNCFVHLSPSASTGKTQEVIVLVTSRPFSPLVGLIFFFYISLPRLGADLSSVIIKVALLMIG
jgi:hypothetical protein